MAVQYIYTFDDVAYDTLEDAVAARAQFDTTGYHLDQVAEDPMAGIKVYVRAMKSSDEGNAYEPVKAGE